MRLQAARLTRRCACLAQAVRRCSGSPGAAGVDFNTELLDYLVCPVSKAPLRWDPVASELVCDEWAVAYPVVDGMPRLRPSDGRVLASPAPVPGAAAPAPDSQPWQS